MFRGYGLIPTKTVQPIESPLLKLGYDNLLQSISVPSLSEDRLAYLKLPHPKSCM